MTLAISTFFATSTQHQEPIRTHTDEDMVNAVIRWLVALLLVTALQPVAAQRAPVQANGVAPTTLSEPTLRVGDALRINVWRHPELSGEFVIGPDSSLRHPVYQSVKVAGAALPLVEQRLRTLLVVYDEEVQLIVEPVFPITVAGEVRQPNLYRLPQGTTLAQAVALAGGPTELGRLDKVRLIRRDSALEVNLGSGYSRYQSLTIASGDQVIVARRSSFNVLRDLMYPLASFTAAIAAILAYGRR